MSNCNHTNKIYNEGFLVCEECGLTFDRQYEKITTQNILQDHVFYRTEILEGETRLHLSQFEKYKYPQFMKLLKYHIRTTNAMSGRPIHTIRKILTQYLTDSAPCNQIYFRIQRLMNKFHFKNRIETLLACLVYELLLNNHYVNTKDMIKQIKAEYDRFSIKLYEMTLSTLRFKCKMTKFEPLLFMDVAIQQLMQSQNLPECFRLFAKKHATVIYECLIQKKRINSHKTLIARIVYDLGKLFTRIYGLPTIHQINYSTLMLKRPFALKDYSVFLTSKAILPFMMAAKDDCSLLLNK